MSRSRQDAGLAGEQLAARFLESRGYSIVARRYRTRFGEIDIVAARDGLVVFVEVKTRRGLGFGSPFEAVHRAKQARIVRVASQFLRDHATAGGDDPGCRFDVIAISPGPGGRPRLEHIEDAFRPPE